MNKQFYSAKPVNEIEHDGLLTRPDPGSGKSDEWGIELNVWFSTGGVYYSDTHAHERLYRKE